MFFIEKERSERRARRDERESMERPSRPPRPTSAKGERRKPQPDIEPNGV